MLLQPAAGLAAGAPTWHTQPAPGADLYRAGNATVLVVDTARPDQLLRAVHAAGVRTIDLLVVTRQSRTTSAAVASLLARIHARNVAGADAGDVVVGPMAVRVKPTGVEVSRR